MTHEAMTQALRQMVERASSLVGAWLPPLHASRQMHELDGYTQAAQREADDITRTSQEICALLGEPKKPGHNTH